MIISKEHLLNQASHTGFRSEILEKVFHLFGILDGFRSHPALKGKLVLKGGTALNLFIFNMPRLSVDIDLNFIGVVELEEMKRQRPDIERAIIAVCEREGFKIKRIPSEHAGGKWRLQYTSAMGQSGTLEVDLNFLLRLPLWPVQVQDSRDVGSFKMEGFPLLDIHELAAGKLAALFARSASRDLFDTRHMLGLPNIDKGKLRTGFMVYAGMNRKDFRLIKIDDVSINLHDLRTQLIPVLRGIGQLGKTELKDMQQRLGEECRDLLSLVLPYTNEEIEFLDSLNDHGVIKAELLTDDPELRNRISNQPALLWKALNVKQYRARER